MSAAAFATGAGRVLREPMQTGAILGRPHLERRLDDVLSRRLAIVVAGAGYGKSTLVAAWSEVHPTAWTSLDANATDLASVAARVVRSVAGVLPGLPDELEATALRAAAEPARDPSRPEALAALLCEALETGLERDLVLVIDDLHELEPEAAAARFIESIVRGAPRRLHIVLISRRALPFQIERLRGQGQVVELTGDQLRFARSEVEAMLGALGPPDQALVDALLRRTAGWPALVRLVIESLRDEPPDARAKALERLAEPGGRLLAYITEEVLQREPETTLEVLRVASRFDQVDADLLSGIGVDDAEVVLDDLARRAFLVEERHDRTERIFTLHHLVAATVRTHLPLPPRELRDLRLRAARWLEAGDRSADAIRQLIAVPDAAGVAELLAARGNELLAQGALGVIIDGVGLLRPDQRSSQHEVLLGDAHLRRGEWHDALAAFDRAGGRRDPLAAALAWRIGVIQHERGDAVQALATFERADLEHGDPEDLALVAAWRSITHWQRADSEGCRPWARYAMEVASRAGSDRAMAAALAATGAVASMDGDARATEDAFRGAVAAAERAGDLLIGARFRTDYGYILMIQGRYEDALTSLDTAVRLARAAGGGTFQAIAHCDRGEAHLELGHIEEADADFRMARQLYEDAGSAWASYAVMRQAHLLRLRGETAAARRAYEEALPGASSLGPAWYVAEVQVGLAATIVEDDPGQALELCDDAVGFAASGEPGARVAVEAARVALQAGEPAIATTHADRALQRGEARRDRPAIASALDVLGGLERDPAAARSLLDRASAVWSETGSALGKASHLLTRADVLGGPDGARDAQEAATRFRRMGARRLAVEADAVAERLAVATRPEVEIQALGGFRVLRSGVPVGASGWRSRKARDLLKLLVVRRGRASSREELCEFLWPDEDPAPLLNRLSVALAVIRTVLDPERRHASDHFIRADKDSVALEPASLRIDVEDFLAAVGVARRTMASGTSGEPIQALMTAEGAFGGDLFADDPYVDWAQDLREEVRAAYLEVARALAARAAEVGDADSAIRLFLRILERDPYDEVAHLGLVRALASAGRHGEARRRFGVYTVRMAELDVEAAPYPVTGGSAPAPGQVALSPR